jgi:hypothetical protein
MALKEKLQRLQRDEIGPGLIELFDEIERPLVDRMPGHFHELLPKNFDAVRLRGNQPADRLRYAPGGGPYPFKQRVDFCHSEDGRSYAG